MIITMNDLTRERERKDSFETYKQAVDSRENINRHMYSRIYKPTTNIKEYELFEEGNILYIDDIFTNYKIEHSLNLMHALANVKTIIITDKYVPVTITSDKRMKVNPSINTLLKTIIDISKNDELSLIFDFLIVDEILDDFITTTLLYLSKVNLRLNYLAIPISIIVFTTDSQINRGSTLLDPIMDYLLYDNKVATLSLLETLIDTDTNYQRDFSLGTGTLFSAVLEHILLLMNKFNEKDCICLHEIPPNANPLRYLDGSIIEDCLTLDTTQASPLLAPSNITYTPTVLNIIKHKSKDYSAGEYIAEYSSCTELGKLNNIIFCSQETLKELSKKPVLAYRWNVVCTQANMNFDANAYFFTITKDFLMGQMSQCKRKEKTDNAYIRKYLDFIKTNTIYNLYFLFVTHLEDNSKLIYLEQNEYPTESNLSPHTLGIMNMGSFDYVDLSTLNYFHFIN